MFQFVVIIPSESSQGLYNLYFHNCPNYKNEMAVKIDFKVNVCFNIFIELKLLTKK